MQKIYLVLIPLLLISACVQQGTQTTSTTLQETKIFISSFPESVAAGEYLAITWRIDGPERAIDHTAVHYGNESVQAKVPSDYPKVSRIQEGTIPAVYSTVMVINEPGIYYFRAHAIVDSKHVWSEEKSFVITFPGILCADVCVSAGYSPGGCRDSCLPGEINWGPINRCPAPKTCCCKNETATNPENCCILTTGPGGGGICYGPGKDIDCGTSKKPNTIPVECGKCHWGICCPNETTTQAQPLPPTTLPAKFTIEADDSSFYPSGTVNVAKNSNVEITFRVRNTNVYYGGLQIKSEKFDTGSIVPGGEKTVSFVADKSFTFTSYWPASNAKKADGQVVVS